MIDEIIAVKNQVYNASPLIHCITNPISINLCDNGILAIGGLPIMAEHPLEVAEITSTAKALLLNLGNITDIRMKSMEISAKAAMCCNIPIVIDLVGVACSKLRREFFNDFISKFKPKIIKGNYSEIYALYNENYSHKGVDAEISLDINTLAFAARTLSQKYNCIVLASGKADIVASKDSVFFADNGCARLSSITGTGCLLGALVTTYSSVTDNYLAAALAGCIILGLCGELSENSIGNGSFGVSLLDSLSTIKDEYIKSNSKFKEVEIEKV